MTKQELLAEHQDRLIRLFAAAKRSGDGHTFHAEWDMALQTFVYRVWAPNDDYIGRLHSVRKGASWVYFLGQSGVSHPALTDIDALTDLIYVHQKRTALDASSRAVLGSIWSD